MSEDVRNRPRFRADDASRLAKDFYGLVARAHPLPSERDQNFRLECESGEEFVLKLANSRAEAAVLDLEQKAMERIAARSRAAICPRVRSTLSGAQIMPVRGDDGESYLMRLVTYLPGVPLAKVRPHPPELLRDLGRLLGAVSKALDGFSHPAADRELDWDLKNACAVVQRHEEDIADPGRRGLAQQLVSEHERSVLPVLPRLRKSVIHNDGNDHNILVHQSSSADRRSLSIIDFGDMVHSCTVYELAVCVAYAMLGKDDPLAAAAHVVDGFHEVFPLIDVEPELLFHLACMRLCTSVAMSAHQRKLEPDNEYLSISEEPAWELLVRLAEIHPQRARDWFTNAKPGKRRVRRRSGLSLDEILRGRRKHLGRSLSVSYKEPLTIVRGQRQYLYDNAGRAYLDAVNNVCHVGHCHPRVVEAAHKQIAVLNTNTRYLHENIVRYAERLSGMLPDPLSVCFFVCTGSEANDLALRLARAYTERTDVIVVDGAYHGNLTSLIEISPYKFDGPGGAGTPLHVHKVVMPDGYRGVYKTVDPHAGKKYALHVETAVNEARERGRTVAAFFCESLVGCGGQIVLPEGYLRAAYGHVRAAGGVCVADEVQVGFGRVGSHFWGFETQGVVPDIVTLGKPIGNGHPMAAVVTTPDVADAFASGMEYFNTFGGNPVSCAVGLAVLDVIEDQRLQENALNVGARMKAGCEQLKAKYPVIGDVRGLGLFLGIELVLDRETLAPAADIAAYVVERMKDLGILVSTDGPLHNVLKIKPPMVFTEADADRLVSTLDRILAEDAAQVPVARRG